MAGVACTYCGSAPLALAIVGSRHYTDAARFAIIVDTWCARHGAPSCIISGGARGADTLAARYARAHDIPLTVFAVSDWEWTTRRKAAGPRRNARIVAAATHMIALPLSTSAEVRALKLGTSAGTRDSIAQARAAGVPVVAIEWTPTKRTADAMRSELVWASASRKRARK